MMKKIGSSLRDYHGEDEVITSLELLDLIKKQVPIEPIYSKLPTLDKVLDGFEPGEVIAISGPTKGGKTLLGQTLTTNFEEQNIRSLWFSYELTPRQFLSRFEEIPFFLIPKMLKAYALDWMQERILEATHKYGIRVVFIDHLHFLFDIARSKNTSLEIGQIMRWLKTIAIELNVIIFLLCHFQKIRSDDEPDHSNIRDSSFVAQESDTGLVLWRVKDSENHAWLKVCYSRRTGTLEKKIKIVKINNLLREVDYD